MPARTWTSCCRTRLAGASCCPWHRARTEKRWTSPSVPINAQTEKALLYREWVEERRAYVAKASGGRLGYVHMFDMGAGSLAQLYVDLDAENQTREGVVIDVRHNNGGFVNAYAIDVFARKGYMTMTSRGGVEAPARTVLGQRSLEAPTALVTDQHSLSDAEDFTEGYRTLKLGPVIGEPTAGWIIYTSNVNLIDGSSLRIPSTVIRGSDGKVMEMNPRPGRRPGRATDRRELHRQGFAARRGGA